MSFSNLASKALKTFPKAPLPCKADSSFSIYLISQGNIFIVSKKLLSYFIDFIKSICAYFIKKYL